MCLLKEKKKRDALSRCRVAKERLRGRHTKKTKRKGGENNNKTECIYETTRQKNEKKRKRTLKRCTVNSCRWPTRELGRCDVGSEGGGKTGKMRRNALDLLTVFFSGGRKTTVYCPSSLTTPSRERLCELRLVLRGDTRQRLSRPHNCPLAVTALAARAPPAASDDDGE